MRVILSLSLLTGCGTTQLSQSDILDRIRLLGVRAEIDEEPDPVLGTRAEPRPGDTVVFSSLTYFPEEESFGGALWIGCLPEGELAYGCEVDEDALDQFDQLDNEPTPEELGAALQAAEEAGLIGFEPLFSPSWTIPTTALDGLTDTERLEGVNAFINVSLFPDTEDFDTADAEVGFKRMPVSEAPTPNHNPDISDFVVAGETLEGRNGFTASPGQTYTIEPVVPPGHTETYAYQTSSGENEYRSEELYFLWYTEPGASKTTQQASFDQPLSLAPYSAVEWTAPKKSGRVTIHAVVRDRRGGMGWRSLEVNVL